MKHHEWAKRPPMGWNSWDCYGAAVREDEVRANADYMAANMLRYGWEYIVVDIQWYEPDADSSRYRKYVPLAMDYKSRLVPAANRFPSSANGKGFRPLSDYVHGLGLKFGIHIMRGIPRQAAHAATPILGSKATARDIAHPNSICPWNTDMYGVDTETEGARAYYDSLFKLYAEWGVDFVKIDDICASRLYGSHQAEIALIRDSIDTCGRPMVLSLSPGPAPLEHAAAFAARSNMWRITDDFWDKWELLADMFDRCERWYPYAAQGHWPDCDMLPLGHIGIRSVDGGAADRRTRFTHDEQRTMLSLWSIFRSPLIMGGELRDNDDWTLSLLTNPEVLEVDQAGSLPRLVSHRGAAVVWASDAPGGSTNVALFNIGESALRVGATWDDLGIVGAQAIRDIWERKDLPPDESGVWAELVPHGSLLLKVARN
ncbi:MAG: glycoside hydrolase family 27 protein [Rectinemataceae bacterium]